MDAAQNSASKTPIKSSRIAIAAIFGVYLVNSLVLGNWIPRIPDVKQHLGISDSVLGFCILALPMGTLLSFVVASSFVQRLGLKKSCGIFQAAWALAFMLPAFANNVPVLLIGLFVTGVSVGFIEVAINAKAAEMEGQLAKSIMSRCHGFWSIGAMMGALMGSIFAYYDISTPLHFAIIMPLLALMGFGFAWGLPADDADAELSEHMVFKIPSKALLLLCAVPLGIMAMEGIYIDWSAIYLRDIFGANPFVAGSVYVLFSSMMALSRIGGDWLAVKLGSVRLVFWSAIMACTGMVALSLSPNITCVYIASILCGLGVGNVYPQVMSAAAKRPGNATDNVAAVSLVVFCMFLFTPTIVGFLSDSVGMRIAFLCYVPIAGLAVVLAGQVKSQK